VINDPSWLYTFYLSQQYNPPFGGDVVPAGLTLADLPYLL
jgi:hypothetical protein